MAETDTIPECEPLALGRGGQAPLGVLRLEGGTVSSASGFRAAGIHAGFRKNPERFDLALVVADEPCACAATFTQNVFCAAPIMVSREHLGGASCGTARALIVNSGTANAATGDVGLANARRTADLTAEALGCPAGEVMVASTGVIGVQLPMEVFQTGIPAAVRALSENGGHAAARAIMTTDTHPKEAAVTFDGGDIGYPGCTFTIGGMAKGSGMIMPNMATMISCITTDAPVLPDALREALVQAVQASFNRVTVDSDTSTNDCCFAFASGAATPGQPPFAPGSAAFARFSQALESLCVTLARAMAADGEGATKLVTVHVANAANAQEADAAARTVANSPLVKTAVYGKDANWGRIAAALGRSGARFNQEGVDIDILGLPVLRAGLPVPFSEEEALRRFERPEVVIEASLGAGTASSTMWTCDFSHEYVTINGDYRT